MKKTIMSTTVLSGLLMCSAATASTDVDANLNTTMTETFYKDGASIDRYMKENGYDADGYTKIKELIEKSGSHSFQELIIPNNHELIYIPTGYAGPNTSKIFAWGSKELRVIRNIGSSPLQYLNLGQCPHFNLDTVNWDMLANSLVELHLDNMGLTSIPAGVLKLSRLETLNVTGNSLKTLPADLTTLGVHLGSLKIGGNPMLVHERDGNRQILLDTVSLYEGNHEMKLVMDAKFIDEEQDSTGVIGLIGKASIVDTLK